MRRTFLLALCLYAETLEALTRPQYIMLDGVLDHRMNLLRCSIGVAHRLGSHSYTFTHSLTRSFSLTRTLSLNHTLSLTQTLSPTHTLALTHTLLLTHKNFHSQSYLHTHTVRISLLRSLPLLLRNMALQWIVQGAAG